MLLYAALFMQHTNVCTENYSVLFYGEASAWPLVSKWPQLPYLISVGLLLIICKNIYNWPVKAFCFTIGIRRQPFSKSISTQRRCNPLEGLRKLDVSDQGSVVGCLVPEMGTNHHWPLGLFLSLNQSVLSMYQHCSMNWGAAVSKTKPLLLKEEESWS